MTPADSVVHVEIELTECSGEVVVNGVPAVTCPEVLPSFTQSIPVNPLVVTGRNSLELAVDLDLEAPSLCRRPRKRALPTAARAVARLVRYSLAKGTFASPEQGEILAILEWKSADDRSDASPRELRVAVDLGESYGRWSWQDAPPITIDEGTRLEVIGVLESIRSALKSGDAAAVLRIIDVKFREVGSAYPGADDEADRASFARWVRAFGADPDRVLPIDHAALDLRLAAEGRLLIPMTRAFTSAIALRMPVTDEDGSPRGDVDVPYEVKLARLGGALRVVR